MCGRGLAGKNYQLATNTRATTRSTILNHGTATVPELLILLIPLFLIAFGIMAYVGHLQAKQRRQELMQVADELNWMFDPTYRSDWHSRFSQFDCFTRGHSRAAFNLMRGTVAIEGRSFLGTMGDYTYKVTSGSGKNRSTKTYYISFLLLELPFRGVPHMAVRPEGIFDSFSAFMGFDDIDFESEEFSRRFHVKSSDKRFAYDVIDPRMMEFLLAGDPPTFEIDRGAFLLQSKSGRWQPAEFRPMLAWSERFFARWPRHVVDNLISLEPL
jgi:hypothetical protein